MTPVEAVRRLLAKTGWSLSDVDLIELNEAFAAQAVAVIRELALDPARVNVQGGAVALGHAIGSSRSASADDAAVCTAANRRTTRHRDALSRRRQRRCAGDRTGRDRVGSRLIGSDRVTGSRPGKCQNRVPGSSCSARLEARSRCCSSIRAARSGRDAMRAPGRFRRARLRRRKNPWRRPVAKWPRSWDWTPTGAVISLTPIVQKAGKVVQAWAIEADWNPATLQSNTFELEWPRGSGRVQHFPEVDRAAWFSIDEARQRIIPSQVPFLDQLTQLVS